MSTVTKISQAAVGGLSNWVGAYEQKQMCISNVVSHQFSFSRFMSGIHKRVGQVRKPDKEMSIKVLHAADTILEEEWAGARTIGQKKRIAEMGTWFVGGFCTGLRGKEMLTIELAGRANSLIHLNNEVKIPNSSLSSWDKPRESSCWVQSLESLVFLSRKELT